LYLHVFGGCCIWGWDYLSSSYLSPAQKQVVAIQVAVFSYWQSIPNYPIDRSVNAKQVFESLVLSDAAQLHARMMGIGLG
jgi:hypothetical protein